jgi:hypothetical protein
MAEFTIGVASGNGGTRRLEDRNGISAVYEFNVAVDLFCMRRQRRPPVQGAWVRRWQPQPRQDHQRLPRTTTQNINRGGRNALTEAVFIEVTVNQRFTKAVQSPATVSENKKI